MTKVLKFLIAVFGKQQEYPEYVIAQK